MAVQFKDMTDDQKQWVQAMRLVDGFENKEEPDATQYFDTIQNSIEAKYGRVWVNIVLKRFTEVQMMDERHRQRKRAAALS